MTIRETTGGEGYIIEHIMPEDEPTQEERQRTEAELYDIFVRYDRAEDAAEYR